MWAWTCCRVLKLWNYEASWLCNRGHLACPWKAMIALPPISWIWSRASLTSPLLILYYPTSSAAQILTMSNYESTRCFATQNTEEAKSEIAEGWWGSAGHQGETISVHGKLTFCNLYHFANGYIVGTSWWVRAKLDMTLHWNCFTV